MENIKEINWQTTKDDQLNNDVLRRHRDEDMRDDDVITSNRVSDSKLPTIGDTDDDDANLADDDLAGRDLDVDNADEWDEADMEKELDERDLEDDDEANRDVHSIKNDQFGSLASSIRNDATPDPDEIPEEHEVGNEEFDAPDEDEFEKGAEPDKEFEYKEQKEVEAPDENEAPHRTTLDHLDSNVLPGTHGRTSGRMTDHEPGTPNNI